MNKEGCANPDRSPDDRGWIHPICGHILYVIARQTRKSGEVRKAPAGFPRKPIHQMFRRAPFYGESKIEMVIGHAAAMGNFVAHILCNFAKSRNVGFNLGFTI